jgi:hypothetical protein
VGDLSLLLDSVCLGIRRQSHVKAYKAPKLRNGFSTVEVSETEPVSNSALTFSVPNFTTQR